METSLSKSLDAIVERLGAGDPDGAKQIVKIIKARVDEPRTQLSYAAKLLYSRFDEWTTIEHGTVHVEKMLEILREGGCLA